MAVNTIIGQVARGDDFFLRRKIVDSFCNEIDKGSNILISAPRRIGKTSLMFYLLDNPIKNYQIKYLTTESVNNENEFFRKIYKEIVDLLKGITRLWKQTTVLIKSKRITSINLDGVTIDNKELIYYDELVNLLRTINLEDNKLIIMIDEFSETLENIIVDEGEREAIHFLESNRTLRQIPEFYQKIQFVYTGSIGLENIVSRLNKINSINDLYPFQIPPFTPDESKQLIKKLIRGSDLVINNNQANYIIERIEWLIPYFFQIIIDEIDKIDIEGGAKLVTNDIIDLAIDQALEKRSYFEHWHTRLRKAYKGNEYNFIKYLLNEASKKKIISSNEIFDLATKYDVTDFYKELLNSLKYDGYINNNEDIKEYRYNSPILKMWWLRNVAN